MRYIYSCNIVRDQEEARLTGREAYNVTFPDVPEAITCGWSWDEAVEMAEDCLGLALSFYFDSDEEIPTPSLPTEGQVLIPVPPLVAAKLTINSAMRENGITKQLLNPNWAKSSALKRTLSESSSTRTTAPTSPKLREHLGPWAALLSSRMHL